METPIPEQPNNNDRAVEEILLQRLGFSFDVVKIIPDDELEDWIKLVEQSRGKGNNV